MNRKKDSLLEWYPKIKNLMIPQPKTMIVEVPEGVRISLMDDGLPPEVVEESYKVCEELGYPIFLRTDQASSKHNWKNAAFIESKDDVIGHIYKTIEFNLCADILGLPYKALVFRKYIPLEAEFTAFYGDLPIAKERRYFIRDGEIECCHQYWIKDSIRSPSTKKWERILEDLNKQTKEERKILIPYAQKVGEVLEGYWSIDFAKGEDGEWYLIDMALGDHSFHIPECEHCPDHIKQYYGRKKRDTLKKGKK